VELFSGKDYHGTVRTSYHNSRVINFRLVFLCFCLIELWEIKQTFKCVKAPHVVVFYYIGEL